MEELQAIRSAAKQEGEKASWRLRDYIQVLVITIGVALFLRTFVVEAYRIPSPSMENTLRVGDFLLANKFIYGARSPHLLPFTSVELPRFRVPGFASPSRGDVVVFELPPYAGLHLPSVNYVKRCVGLPGDTLHIVDRRVYVNGGLQPVAETARKPVRHIVPESYGDPRVFPRGARFNEDNYGPVVVPGKGLKVQLDSETFLPWKDIIEYEGHRVRLDGNGDVLIDGTQTDSYTITHDYYFMLGDNRENSLDSRFWGFVPDDLIVGKVMMVYWSLDERRAGSLLQRLDAIRWERIGTIVR